MIGRHHGNSEHICQLPCRGAEFRRENAPERNSRWGNQSVSNGQSHNDSFVGGYRRKGILSLTEIRRKLVISGSRVFAAD